MGYEVRPVMKFPTIVVWDMNAGGGSFMPAKRSYQLTGLTCTIQKTTDGRNSILISLLFYILFSLYRPASNS
jgi:hypothetical protein